MARLQHRHRGEVLRDLQQGFRVVLRWEAERRRLHGGQAVEAAPVIRTGERAGALSEPATSDR